MYDEKTIDVEYTTGIDNTPLSEWDVLDLLGDIRDIHDRLEEVIENS